MTQIKHLQDITSCRISACSKVVCFCFSGLKFLNLRLVIRLARFESTQFER